jgi:hypothetical protein
MLQHKLRDGAWQFSLLIQRFLELTYILFMIIEQHYLPIGGTGAPRKKNQKNQKTNFEGTELESIP